MNGDAYSEDDFTVPFTSTTGKTKTCVEECNGNCCLNHPTVCDNGRFAVCADKDDGSCDGSLACWGVGGAGDGYGEEVKWGKVGLISGGSCVGSEACSDAARAGAVGHISGKSCIGKLACDNAGSRGSVGDIIGSCREERACMSLGMDNPQFGESLDGCCNDDKACMNIGCTWEDCASVRDILFLPSNLPESCLPNFSSKSPTESPTKSSNPTGGTSTKSPSGSPTKSPTDSPASALIASAGVVLGAAAASLFLAW